MSIKREPRLYDRLKTREADYAGRVDILAECSGTWQGVTLDGIYVLDWKSSKEPSDPRGYEEWPMQVGGYRHGTASDSAIKEYIDGNAVIRLDKISGLPTIYDYSDTYRNDLENFHNLVRYYRGANPEYYREKVPSVTSILSALAKPALIQWAANCSRDWGLERLDEWLKQNAATPSSQLVPPNLVRQWFEECSKNFRKVGKVAADIGTDCHALIEQDLKHDRQPTNKNQLSLALENAWEAYLTFKQAIQLRPIKIEYKIHGLISQSV